MRYFVAFVALGLIIGVAAGEAKPLGPIVDITLDSGESHHGELLSFENGQLSVKTNSGVVTRDGSKVLTVKFIAPPKPPAPPPPLPSAQLTRLSESERQRLLDFRFGARAVQRMSPGEERDFKDLQDRLDRHIVALEREIKSAKNEEDAFEDLLDLARSYLFQGRDRLVVRPLTKGAAESIENESVKMAVQRRMPVLIKDVMDKFEDRLNILRPKKNK